MWDTYNEDRAPRAYIGSIVRIAIIASFAAIILAIASNQSAKLFMNLTEFGTVFTKSLYYSIVSGLLLAAVSVIRINFRARQSMTWYGINLILMLVTRGRRGSESRSSRYSDFKMSNTRFVLWQLTKMMLFAPILSNTIFGMTLEYAIHGNDIGISSIAKIFLIPFSTLPLDGSYASQNVIPMLPGLTLLVPPLLNAVGIHLFLYIGIAGVINIGSSYVTDKKEGKPKILSYISEIEIIAGVAISWAGFNMFFSSMVDYNTPYVLSIMITLGVALVVYGFLDRRHAKVIIYPTKKVAYLRLGTAVIAAVLAGSIITVNNSIADAKKIEWYGPHIAQEIAVNRYIHGLDQIQTVDYNIGKPSASSSNIQSTLSQYSAVLSSVRLWDENNAKSKLSQTLDVKNNISLSDPHVLRFGGNTYWAAAASPSISEGIAQPDKWLKEHMVYTYSDQGVKMLEANTGSLIDQTQFFRQNRIYYGESGQSGIFSRFWSAFP
ncbi:MAG: hypothetical protein M3258_05340, partial [Thermoproteota archaeon]|nr:hypothetical protein [Thermoproteota archaeon]